MRLFLTIVFVLGSIVLFPKKISIFCSPCARTFYILFFVLNIANVSMLPPPQTFFYFPWCNLFQLGLIFSNNNPITSFIGIPLYLLFYLTRLFATLFVFLGHALPVADSWRNIFLILPTLMFNPFPFQISCFLQKICH